MSAYTFLFKRKSTTFNILLSERDTTFFRTTIFKCVLNLLKINELL